MISASDAGERSPPFQWPTTVFLHGPPEPLLNWVAWAFVRSAPGGYRWADGRAPTDLPDPLGPIAKGAIPQDLLSTPESLDLAPDHAAANAAITGARAADGGLAQLERVSDFLRLPSGTRARIVSAARGGPPLVLVVSNSHRLLPHHDADTVRATLRTVVAHGIAVFGIFPSVVTEARFMFGNVWRLSASDLPGWRETWLEVERAEPQGPIPTTGSRKLGEPPTIVEVLGNTLDPML